ncbi:hypothetical protein [Thiocystis violacea]|uniref:hypothetical protein n=1 Tax=Thiocystis violacea TaxID=13725 RepID=UPI0019033F14|nr:hypothetical protein [Thiocystis violacea]
MSGFVTALLQPFVLVALLGAPAQAAPPPPEPLEAADLASTEAAIPDALKPWIPWVLGQDRAGSDRRGCVLDAQGVDRLCAWPGPLHLELEADGGRFEQIWQLQAEDWVPLPGDVEIWPQETQDGDRPLAVIAREGRPVARLAPGTHRLTGRFQWRSRPESLPLPPETGILTLVLDGQPHAAPRLETGGRLWLRDPAGAVTDGEGDQLRLEVYRRIEDSLPLRVLTRLELEVSGRAREARLGPVALPDGIPLRVESALPTRLERDGTLRIQVRPGRWVLEVASYHPGAVTGLARATGTDDWPEQEVWAFAARPELRQVEVSGLDAIDPRQTGLPADWARLPVYRAGPEDVLRLAERRRGDPDPEPDRLSLSRELWLDFDGQGYSARDRIRGDLTRSWRLESGSELELGQVQVSGSPLLITRLEDQAAPGVEVRRGTLDLIAEGRLAAAPDRIPASGWALTFDAARSRLHLPPGWDLLAVAGVDNIPDTWLARWTLLDLFLVLILTLGIGRIWGRGWGLLALAALVLSWQSPDAPRLVWLHVLAAAALLRLLPRTSERPGLNRLRGLVSWYRRLGLLALLVLGLPFLVSEVRDGLYPHLAQSHWTPFGGQSLDGSGAGPADAMSVPEPAFDTPLEMRELTEPRALLPADVPAARKGPAAPAPAPPPPEMLDPKALVQTGPGIPNWSWKAFDLTWTGPVGSAEQARLWLLTPFWNLILALGGGLLLVVLALRLAGVIEASRRPPAGSLLVLTLALLVGSGFAPRPVLASEFPSPQLLEELRGRLLAPPDCLPDCLVLSRLGIRAEPERLTLELTLEAATGMAAEVLGGQAGWTPSQVSLNGLALDRLRRGADGRLLVPLPPGRHQLRLTGPLGGEDRVDLPLALMPRLVTQETEGWRLEGLDAAGRAGPQLQLIRLAGNGVASTERLTQDALPPLLLIERRLALGIDWRVETLARRLSSPEFPLLVPVPLLPGESVRTADVQVESGQVKVVLMPGETERSWTSSLEPAGELRLTASDDPRLAESWRLDLGSMWHLEHSGIAPVHHREAGDRWLPSWRPLPGETLRLRITRPSGVPGPTLTLDRVDYRVDPGRRGSDAVLTLVARSSQGGVHGVRLPDGVELRQLSLDGRSLPLPASGSSLVELPLVPGRQEAMIAWRAPRTLSPVFTPEVPDLGLPAVNLTQTLRLPDDRWVLFAAGPGLGPAVLFWGLLIVLTGLALGLGRNRLTPLRFHDWFLLGIGLALVEVWAALLIAGWLFALGLRRELDEGPSAWRFNLIQIGLVLLTLAALAALIGVVQQGLLGRPEMQIMGNGSSGGLLNWYQDRGGPTLPEVWVLSVPMWIYRALMLGWALWLAFRLLDWLRWGWEGFSRPRLWRERVKKAPGSSI